MKSEYKYSSYVDYEVPGRWSETYNDCEWTSDKFMKVCLWILFVFGGAFVMSLVVFAWFLCWF